MASQTFILHTDGGSRGNPGVAASAAVLFDHQYNKLDQVGEYIGETTNNQAEYKGLLIGLQLAKKNKVSDLVVCMDSELVVKQMLGEYKIKDMGLKDLAEQAKIQLKHFTNYKFKHVRREKNKEADALVNEVLDNR